MGHLVVVALFVQTCRRAVAGWQLDQHRWGSMASALTVRSPNTQKDLSLSVYVDDLIKLLLCILQIFS